MYSSLCNFLEVSLSVVEGKLAVDKYFIGGEAGCGMGMERSLNVQSICVIRSICAG